MDVKLVARTVALFELFAQVKRPMPLTELAQSLGVPMSSCLALVRTLVAHGYLYEVRRRGGYYPTAKLHGVSSDIGTAYPWRAAAHEHLVALRDAVNETVMLGKIQDGSAVYLDVVRSGQAVHYATQAGVRRPLHTSSVAKAILGQIDEAERNLLLADADYMRFTPTTCVTFDALLADIARAKARGWASNIGESVADLTGYAAALDMGGEWYAVGMAGPTPRMLANSDAYVYALQNTVQSIRAGVGA